MSNVLIGIIGVILFIGLALAGALILGDDFKTASVESKASAIISVSNQVAEATNMYQLKTGLSAPSGSPDYLVSRFVKQPPRNPVYDADEYRPVIVDVDGNVAGPAYAVIMPVADMKVCLKVALDLGFPIDGGGEQPAYVGAMPTASAGCIAKHSATPAGKLQQMTVNRFYAFVRI